MLALRAWGRRARNALSVGEAVDEYAWAPLSVRVLCAVALSASIIAFLASGFTVADVATKPAVSDLAGNKMSRKFGECSSGMMGKVTT